MLLAKNHLRYVTLFLLVVSALPPLKVGAARGQQYVDSQIANAKTAYLTSEILHPKGDKEPFTSELNSIVKIAYETKIWSVFKPATAEKADIIMKIVEDRTPGSVWTLTLHVYDPEDNRELYTEKREYIEISNDIHRLMNHLLNSVLEQRKFNKEESEQKSERERAAKEHERSVGTAEVTCDNVKLFANKGAERRIRRILNKGDRVVIVTPANSETVVKVGDIWGYVDTECVRVLAPN
jgi:hypothetical protein